MKKTLTTLIMTIMFILSSSIIITPNTFAMEAFEMEKYYDLNKDSLINIADSLYCERAIENGTLSTTDRVLLQNYLSSDSYFDNIQSENCGITFEQEILFEEWDIDYMEPTEESINWLITVMHGHIVDREIYDKLVRFRFLNEGIVTEIRLERISEIVETVKVLDYEGERIVLGITEDGKFAWDTYSFDLTPDWSEESLLYEEWDLDYMSVTEENNQWLTSVTSNRLLFLESPELEGNSFRFMFAMSDNNILEIRIARVGEVVEPLINIEFEGKSYNLGINENGEYALCAI